MSALPDSGLRTTFNRGGAHREADPDKPLLEAISPYALDRLGLLLAKAEVKYKDVGGCRNWEKGMPITRYQGAIGRHNGGYLRRDTTEDHMAAVMWNAMCVMHHEEIGAFDGTTHWTFEQLDDRPFWLPRGET